MPTITPMQLTYAAVITTAPAEYDYAGVVPLPENAVDVEALPIDVQYAIYNAKNPVRFLLVPFDNVTYQTNRYQSGFYFATAV